MRREPLEERMMKDLWIGVDPCVEGGEGPVVVFHWLEKNAAGEWERRMRVVEGAEARAWLSH